MDLSDCRDSCNQTHLICGRTAVHVLVKGEEHPRELIAQVKDLSADEVARIEGLNAVKLLNITPVR